MAASVLGAKMMSLLKTNIWSSFTALFLVCTGNFGVSTGAFPSKAMPFAKQAWQNRKVMGEFSSSTVSYELVFGSGLVYCPGIFCSYYLWEVGLVSSQDFCIIVPLTIFPSHLREPHYLHGSGTLTVCACECAGGCADNVDAACSTVGRQLSEHRWT